MYCIAKVSIQPIYRDPIQNPGRHLVYYRCITCVGYTHTIRYMKHCILPHVFLHMYYRCMNTQYPKQNTH